MLSRAYPMLLCDLACVLADYPVATLPDDEVPEFILSEGLEEYHEIIEHIKWYIGISYLPNGGCFKVGFFKSCGGGG